MVLRWIRNALVLSLAALIARVVAERRSARDRSMPIPDGPLLIRGRPAGRYTSTFEPHGAL